MNEQNRTKLLIKYEEALIDIASFQEGNLGGHMDEPGSAGRAREALGKRICTKILELRRKKTK